MNKTLKVRCAALVVLTGAAASPSVADQGAWTAGMGVAVVQSPYRSADDVIAPIPFATYTRGRLSVGPLGARYSFYHRSGLDLAVVAQPRLQPFDFDDAPALAGVEQRDSTLELGLGAHLESHGAALDVDALTDVLGVHNGQQVRVSASVDLADGPITLAPGVAVAWQSADLIDYYYGVRASEVQPGRSFYEPDDAVTMSVNLDLRYPMSYQLWAVAMISYAIFPYAIADSPLVEDDGAGRFM